MRLATPFVLLVLALALVVYLDDTPSDADFTFVNRNDVFTLDPQRMSYIQDFRLAYALYEGLVRWNNKDFTIQAAAAGLPEVSKDGRTYTFRLRPDGRWSNGDPVTAHDFCYSWMRAMLPDTAADYSNLFFVIDGGRAFFDERSEQTAALLANPMAEYQSAGRIEVGTMRRALGRMRRLIAADELPSAVQWPAGLNETRLTAELNRIESALDVEAEALAEVFGRAEAVQRALQHLDHDAVRAAEADWMWRQTERRFGETVGLAALDDRTLQVRLRRPTAYFLDLVAFGVFCPVHRPTVEGWALDDEQRARAMADGWHAIDAPSLDQRRWSRINVRTGRYEQRHDWTKPHRHVGNGPYCLKQWRYKRDMRLVRSDTYHSPDMVKSDAVAARVITDTNTSVLAFETGRFDWLSDVSAEYQADMLEERRRYIEHHRETFDRLRGQGLSVDEALVALPAPGAGERRNIHAFPTFGTDFYSFNCRPTLADGSANPFADAAVRCAFAMSVDKQTIVENVTRLNEPVMNTLIPPGSIPGYESPEGLGYDPVEARRRLAQAGWSDRNGDGLVENDRGALFPLIDLVWTTNTPRYKWVSLELKAQWERELGVRIELRGADTKFYKDDLIQGKFMIARGNWFGDYGDPTTFLDLCKSTDGNNDRKFSSAVIDKLLEQAELERDPHRRMEILRECERILFEEEMPMVPICQLLQIYMYEPGGVKGLSRHPRLTQFLWEIEVERP